ncbi:histidine kinase [Clostridium estertheticum]|uniref:sensor histidine kinase n=1 Tax=Clostridium estertheticum TaxID=238834 RepID=UPI0013E95C80|nr:histidine kinase [Clostridium estertheticum]MBZ9689206.1 histidine kinase [Clostridium estertheticum]
MINKGLDKKFTIKTLNGELKIIYLYRYFSLVLTSLFYLASDFQVALEHKLIVVVCLSISAIILNHLYVNNQNMKNVIKMLIIIEIIGNIMILIPTGGLKSPYIWYSLNTVLISIYFLNIYYCTANILSYLIFSTAISFAIFNKEEKSIFEMVINNSNLILSLILITVLAQLLSTLTKKLNKESKKLNLLNDGLIVSNERTKESIEHIMSLYQAMHSFINQSDKSKLIKIITYYTKEITKSNLTFFCTLSNKEELEVDVNGELTESYKDDLLKEIKKQWGNLSNTNKAINFYINNFKFAAVIVKYSHKQYGVLGIEINDNEDRVIYKDNIDQLRFLSELSAMVFEKLHLEEINNHLLIAEEQNRIANEIHDSVSQRLFSISCATHTLKGKLNLITEEKLEIQLNIINDSLNKAMKELRETIYGLSSRKGGGNTFQQDITNYINDISKLNNAIISFNISGNQDLMNCDLKKALYRIICEGTGNALHHGKCDEVEITLNIKDQYTELMIIDNGIGFDLKNKIDNKEIGLGIKNMLNLVKYLNGEINIDSKFKIGTSIKVMLPNFILINKEQGEVV